MLIETLYRKITHIEAENEPVEDKLEARDNCVYFYILHAYICNHLIALFAYGTYNCNAWGEGHRSRLQNFYAKPRNLLLADALIFLNVTIMTLLKLFLILVLKTKRCLAANYEATT